MIKHTHFILAIMLMIAIGCGTSVQTPPASTRTAVDAATDAATGTVTIQVQAEGIDRDVLVENVKDGSTVADVMRQIDDFEVTITGSGEMTFLSGLDGKSTDATDGWTYTIDGKFADAGIGVTQVHPPTTIQWTYGEWDE